MRKGRVRPLLKRGAFWRGKAILDTGKAQVRRERMLLRWEAALVQRVGQGALNTTEWGYLAADACPDHPWRLRWPEASQLVERQRKRRFLLRGGLRRLMRGGQSLVIKLAQERQRQ